MKNEAASAARALLDSLGDLAGVDVLGNGVLVAIYRRPEKTTGGIIRPDSVKDEDVYQGKAGLVVKRGPLAFKEDDGGDLADGTAKTGDWAVFRVGDGWSIRVNGVPCRMVQDVNIKAVVSNPEMVW